MNDGESHAPPAQIVERLEDIPEFTSDEERSAFWDGHVLSDALWERMRQGDPDLERRLTGPGEADPEPGAAIEFLGPGGAQSGSAEE